MKTLFKQFFRNYHKLSYSTEPLKLKMANKHYISSDTFIADYINDDKIYLDIPCGMHLSVVYIQSYLDLTSSRMISHLANDILLYLLTAIV